MKIIVLQGTPCAGKTTWAKEYVSGKKDWIVISLDELRHSCGDYWDLRREKVITKTEDALIRNAIEANMNMVIDSTNLNPDRIKYLQRIADEMHYQVRWVQILHGQALNEARAALRDMPETVRFYSLEIGD